MPQTLFVASNRLPVTLQQTENGWRLNPSGGGLASALAAVSKAQKPVWIGWPGAREALSHKEQNDISFPEGLVPVYLTQLQVVAYYDTIANNVLWPTLHGLAPTIKPTARDWRVYGDVNALFAKTIAARATATSVIWIHDYHLMLLPETLRSAGVASKIGFFLHTPFPEQFAYAPLLQSLALCDVVGFQTQRDADNFMRCLKAAGIAPKKKAIIRAFPIGIDHALYARQSQQVRQAAASLRASLGDQKVVLSVSRLDYTKGIVDQLRAMERVFRTHPDPKSLTYVLIVAPSREGAWGYSTLANEITAEVERINGALGSEDWQPIHYLAYNHSFVDVNAWYAVADVMLNTPIVDGMNLVAKEYIAAHPDGALVLSNTAGAAAQLQEAILVPPKDIEAIAKGIFQALALPAAERHARWRAMNANVREQDVFQWSDNFFISLTNTAV